MSSFIQTREKDALGQEITSLLTVHSSFWQICSWSASRAHGLLTRCEKSENSTVNINVDSGGFGHCWVFIENAGSNSFISSPKRVNSYFHWLTDTSTSEDSFFQCCSQSRNTADMNVRANEHTINQALRNQWEASGLETYALNYLRKNKDNCTIGRFSITVWCEFCSGDISRDRHNRLVGKFQLKNNKYKRTFSSKSHLHFLCHLPCSSLLECIISSNDGISINWRSKRCRLVEDHRLGRQCSWKIETTGTISDQLLVSQFMRSVNESDETFFDDLVLDRVIPPLPWISSSIRLNSMANRWISNSGIPVSVHLLLSYRQYRCLCIFSGSREIWQYPSFLFSSSTRLHHGRIHTAFASPSIVVVSSRSSMPRERSPTRIWIVGTASCVIFDHRFRACVL